MRALTGRLRGVNATGYDIVRVVLGSILLVAAALKTHQLATEPMLETSLVTSRWFLGGVVEFELLFGLWLLSGRYPKWTWRASLLCFGGFACVSLQKALAGESTCGCFGTVPVDPWRTFGLDLAAIAALAWWRPRAANSAPLATRVHSFSLRFLAVAALALGMGVPAALGTVAYRSGGLSEDGSLVGSTEFVVLRPETWIGEPFPLLDYVDINGELRKGEWTILLVRRDCPRCQNAVVALEREAQRDRDRKGIHQVALIDVSSHAGNATWRHPRLLTGKLSDAKDWLVSTPARIATRDGNVTEVVGDNL